MWFSVSIVEIAIVALALVVATALMLARHRAARSALVITAWLAVAAVISPADPVSCLMMGLILWGAFWLGTRFGPSTSIAGL